VALHVPSQLKFLRISFFAEITKEIPECSVNGFYVNSKVLGSRELFETAVASVLEIVVLFFVMNFYF
jgi:hypothetical protein